MIFSFIKKAFTLLELLVIILLISIIASLAVPIYLRYHQKALVSSYAEPHARSCLLDLIDYCIEHPHSPVTDTVVQNLSNCKVLQGKNAPTPDLVNYVVVPSDSNITNLYYSNGLRSKNLFCTASGDLIDNGTNKETADIVTLIIDENGKQVGPYYAECSYNPKSGIKCYVTDIPEDN